MILYFTGTGNSLCAAKRINETLNDDMLSINTLLQSGDETPVKSDRPLVFVAPIYAWRFPRVVEHFIESHSFEGCMRAYFIATCGSQAGDAEKYIKRLCERRKIEYCGFCAVDMPNNYLVGGSVADKNEIDTKLSAAEPKLAELARLIVNAEKIEDNREMRGAALASSVVNTLFYKFSVNPSKFYTTERCTGCGKCVQQCPLSNIALDGAKPSWGKECTQCLACINLCPRGAIEYGKKTVGLPRYRCPEKKIPDAQ